MAQKQCQKIKRTESDTKTIWINNEPVNINENELYEEKTRNSTKLKYEGKLSRRV